MDIKLYDLMTNVEFDKLLILIHQNIGGLKSKSDEIINLLKMSRVNSHVSHFTEHHVVK